MSGCSKLSGGYPGKKKTKGGTKRYFRGGNKFTPDEPGVLGGKSCKKGGKKFNPYAIRGGKPQYLQGGGKYIVLGGKKTKSKRKGGEGHDDGPRHAIGNIDKEDPAYKKFIDKEELKKEMKNYPNRFKNVDYKRALREEVAQNILDDSDDEDEKVGGGKKTKSKRKTKGKKARKTRRKTSKKSFLARLFKL